MKRLLSIVMSAAVALALLTGSIAVPLLVRPFYYAQIEPLDIEQKSGLSRSEIINAYDEVLDYCNGVTDEFSAGVLPFSQSGAEHFADCRRLFELDFAILAVSAAVILALCVINRKTGLHRFRGHGAPFWGAVGMSGLLAAAGVLVAADFDAAFTAFHGLLFPGKDNWIFDPAYDPIINLLPEEFFRNCAICIFAVFAIASTCTIAHDVKTRKSRHL